MKKFWVARVVRLAPLILVACIIVFIGPDRLSQLRAPERWAVFGCFVIAFLTPIGIARRAGLVALPNARPTQRFAQIFWRAMLVMNVAAFLVGCGLLVMFRNAVPVQYLIIAPCVNLLLVMLLWKIRRAWAEH